MKVSEYYGLDMYSDRGKYIGEVDEVMLDTEKGEIAGLVFEKQGEKYKAVPYPSVMAVGDVVIAKSQEEGPPETKTEKEEARIAKTVEKEPEEE